MIEDADLSPEAREILSRKTGVMIAIPNIQAHINTALAIWLIQLSYKTIDAECPWFFKIHVPNDYTPVEYARNMCVREFMKDPFYKRLWFVDSDMIPPNNALDLLTYDDPIVSAMTYIWACEGPDKEGFYQPPRMKINAFDYRPQTEDFLSKLPAPDNRVFYCDAVGSACVVIHKSVLEAMPEPWYRTVRDPYGETLRSEDLDFCRRWTMQSEKKVLYVPSVQFGHAKLVDLRQVTTYGLSSMRNVIDRVRAAPNDQLAEMQKALPIITFVGEKPKVEAVNEPHDFKVVQGGKA
jgi:hypothetical protein